jgi:hypothetical protein
LLSKVSGAVEGGGGCVEVGDTESLKGLKDIREPYRALIRFLIASGFKERSDKGSEIASI